MRTSIKKEYRNNIRKVSYEAFFLCNFDSPKGLISKKSRLECLLHSIRQYYSSGNTPDGVRFPYKQPFHPGTFLNET